jgi:hypothetical protein
MAKNETIFFTKEGKVEALSPDSGGVAKEVNVGGVNGCKLFAIYPQRLINDFVDFQVSLGGILGYTSIDDLAENENILEKLPLLKDKNGNKYINLEPDSLVRIQLTTPISSGVPRFNILFEQY